ncbi:N-formylglutamate amidohydrolase [Stigmatella sp. ncwal1]|uniref:N-formylglutamate amidohydrolase n=1 Tax=Stigmatella ashevillensis TaxID=2995309 RepID=A0ABT5DAM9_9BACT|nr:N-formylglutamate amidohydrolase [Stigmatella ashevillena]MDC0710165.1 N-formylglutamate amidohydrolase [Stigmatella ashevillena]
MADPSTDYWLAPSEPPSFTPHNLTGTSPCVLLCDHASNRVPQRLKALGLPASELERHIAWDIGARGVALQLSQLLDAPLLMSGYSRLVIDCNRPLSSPGSITGTSDGTLIPANQELTAQERAERAAVFFHPYHDAIRALLDQRQAEGRPTVLVSVHSFTGQFGGKSRPWHVGLAYHRDRSVGPALIEALRRDPMLCVGDNEPYAVDDASDYAIPVHGERRELPCALVEIRQDLLAHESGQHLWAGRLAEALRTVLPNILTPSSSRIAS